MLRGLTRFRSLSRADYALLVRAFLRVGAVDLALRRRGFRQVVAQAQPAPAAVERPVTPDDLRRARRYARWIDSASRHHVVRARCLHRSLALHLWLREEGLPSELRIGVRKEADELRAHAWVQLAGQVINDWPAAVAPFRPLFTTAAPRLSPSGTSGGPAARDVTDTFLRSMQWS